jgi:hypothetical protein
VAGSGRAGALEAMSSAEENARMAEPQVIPVFIPALVVLLHHAERQKGSPLTESEVLAIRDSGVCMMMAVERAIALDEKRGYNDIDPERVWEQWQEARAQFAEQDAEPDAPADGGRDSGS